MNLASSSRDMVSELLLPSAAKAMFFLRDDLKKIPPAAAFRTSWVISLRPRQSSVRYLFSCWEKAWISLRSRSKRAREKNWLMKAVRCSSYVSIVPSLSSSSHVFASLVSDRRGETSLGGQLHFCFRNGDCRTGGRSDNTVGSPHGFIVYGIEIFKGNEKVTEVIDVENWRIDHSRVLRWIVSWIERNSFVSSTNSLIQSTFRFRIVKNYFKNVRLQNSFEIPGSGAKNFDVFQKL
nr:hypothetical protein [Tanacetum cinerariifolium]